MSMGAVGSPTQDVRGPRAPIADVAAQTALQAAFDEVSHELSLARTSGRMILSLPLESVDPQHLVRDRLTEDDEDMIALRDSVRARGQQMPIEVLDLGDGKYGLISGWRRLKALQALQKETSDPQFSVVQALVRQPDTAGDAYKAMVEENEIRANLSYYERARIAAKAAEQGAFPTARHAVRDLFASASRAKRSKINSFLVLYTAFDDALRFPAAITERQGLALVRRLSEETDAAPKIAAQLQKSPANTAEEEQDALSQLIASVQGPAQISRAPVPPTPPQKAVTVEARPGYMLLTGAGVDAALIRKIETLVSKHK
ncbi:ParB N-terminal domain-containing protein [Planktotalea sp.]